MSRVLRRGPQNEITQAAAAHRQVSRLSDSFVDVISINLECQSVDSVCGYIISAFDQLAARVADVIVAAAAAAVAARAAGVVCCGGDDTR